MYFSEAPGPEFGPIFLLIPHGDAQVLPECPEPPRRRKNAGLFAGFDR
jgi:hypothetical protein